MGLCLNASEDVSCLFVAKINRGSSESREAPHRDVYLGTPTNFRQLHEGPSLSSGAQWDGSRISCLANCRPAPNGRTREC